MENEYLLIFLLRTPTFDLKKKLPSLSLIQVGEFLSFPNLLMLHLFLRELKASKMVKRNTSIATRILQGLVPSS
jgi:hypothetical protein